jgi:hypothetical protein
MSRIIKRLYPEVIRKTAARYRKRGLRIPTFKELRHDRRAATHQQHCFRPKLQRLPHVGAVELGTQGWIGADRVVIRPAHEDFGAGHPPGRQISRRLDVHRQAGKTGNPKTELACAQVGRL